MKTKKSFSLLICLLTMIMCVCVGIGTMIVSADTPTSLNSFAMEKGSAVKIVNDSTKSGMKFQMTISNEDYESISAYNPKFGMVIAPKNYVDDDHDFTVANLFQTGAIFYWDDNVINGIGTTDVSPTLNITLAENNAEIWHLEPTMQDLDGKKLLEVQLVNFANNATQLITEYVCRGYVAVTENGNTTYYMANYYEGARQNNTRSMAYVAQKALEELNLIPEEDRTVTQTNNILTLQTGYITPVNGLETTYEVECYETSGDTLLETYSVSSTIGANVIVTPKTIVGKIFDEDNTGNILSGTVGISGTTFKAYYNDVPALVVPSVIEVDCRNGDQIFDLTTIKNVNDEFISGTVKGTTIVDNKITVHAGDRFVFENTYGQSVVIRGNNRTDGKIVDFGTMTDAELLTMTNATYKDATDDSSTNQAVASNSGVNTFSVGFNTNGIVANTVARTLTLVVHNCWNPAAPNLKLQVTDKTGNFTFDERSLPINGWQVVNATLYMPVGMNLSDLVLTFNDLGTANVKVYDFYVKEFAGNELLTLTCDNKNDAKYFTQCGIDTMGVTDAHFATGAWGRNGTSSGKNFAIRLNVLLPSEFFKGMEVRFSVDMMTQGGEHYLAAKVGDDVRNESAYYYNGEFKTFTFDVSENPNFVFEFYSDNSWANIFVDNIKIELLRKVNTPIREIACASGTTTFDLTTIRYEGEYVAGTVKDSNNNPVEIVNDTITVSAGGRYVFTNIYGDTIIIANNKANGKVVDFTTMNDAELLTMTNATYKDATDGSSTNQAVASNSGANTFSVGFNTNGIVANTVARTLTFVVHNCWNPAAPDLKVQATDKSGRFTFNAINVPVNGWQAVNATLYMPVGMNLSDLVLTFNDLGTANVKVYDFYVKEVSENVILNLTFDSANDITKNIAQCGADTNVETVTSGVWYREWSGYNFAFKFKNIILPNEVKFKFSIDMKTQTGKHTLTAQVGEQTFTHTGNDFADAYKTFVFDVTADFTFNYMVNNQHAQIHIDNVKLIVVPEE